MKYESEFRIKVKELEFSGISHKTAINELANIVKEADNRVDELEWCLDKVVKNKGEVHDLLDKAYDEKAGYLGYSVTITCLFILSLALNVYFMR